MSSQSSNRSKPDHRSPILLGRSVYALLKLALCAFFCFACQAPKAPSQGSNQAKPTRIKIGLVSALTGRHATYGNSLKYGIELALSESPKSSLELLALDDQSRPSEAREAAERLISKNRVKLLIGGLTSDAALEMAPIAQRAQIPLLTPSATHPAITEFGDYVFRTCFSDEAQADVMAKFAVGQMKFQRVAIVRDLQSEYSTGLAKRFKKALMAQGATIVAEEVYSAGETNFEPALEQIKKSNAQAVYLPGYHRDVAAFVRQARAFGIEASFLGADGWGAPELWSKKSPWLNGSYYTAHFHFEEPDKAISEFVRRYKNRFNELPDSFAALGYDTGKIVLKAFEQSKGPSPIELKATLQKMAEHPGVTGRIDLKPQAAAHKTGVIVHLNEGRPHFHQRLNPQ